MEHKKSQCPGTLVTEDRFFNTPRTKEFTLDSQRLVVMCMELNCYNGALVGGYISPNVSWAKEMTAIGSCVSTTGSNIHNHGLFLCWASCVGVTGMERIFCDEARRLYLKIFRPIPPTWSIFCDLANRTWSKAILLETQEHDEAEVWYDGCGPRVVAS